MTQTDTTQLLIKTVVNTEYNIAYVKALTDTYIQSNVANKLYQANLNKRMDEALNNLRPLMGEETWKAYQESLNCSDKT